MKRARIYKPPASFHKQPRIAAILKSLGRARGATADEVAARLGWNAASVRAVISRLDAQGAEITRRKERGRGTVYQLIARFTGAKDKTRLTKAQATNLARQGGFKPPR
jgi:predicted ArsR family transcriptional regulator